MRWAALILLLNAGAKAWGASASESEVKAAFLFNFAKYVEWPRRSAETFSICLLGESRFGDVLSRTMEGKKVGDQAISVSLVHTPSQAEGCGIVFISRSEASRLDPLLAHLARRPVLTVSDIEGFADRGGIIGLKTDQKKVRFEVNLVASRLAGLKLSSQLLKVATQVIGQLDTPP
jgi:hypothetical protein